MVILMVILAILVIFAFVYWLETLLYQKIGMKRIKYSIWISTNEANEGDTIQVIEQVTNGSWLPIPWLKTEIAVSQWLEFQDTRYNTKSGLRFVPSIFMLDPYQQCTRVWNVKCVKRGVYVLDDTRLHLTDLFGASTSSMFVEIKDTITVLPSAARSLPSELADEMLYGERVVRRFIAEDPFAISGTREYTGSEPFNHIHWASSARLSQLMVHNNDYTTSTDTLVLMNFQKNDFGALSPAHNVYIETAIKAITLLLERARLSGDKVTIITNSQGDTVPTQGGTIYHHSALRYLAGLTNECDRDFCEMLDKLRFNGEYHSVVLFTSYISENILMHCRRFVKQGKDLVVFCSFIDETVPFSPHDKIIPLGSFNHSELLAKGR